MYISQGLVRGFSGVRRGARIRGPDFTAGNVINNLVAT